MQSMILSRNTPLMVVFVGFVFCLLINFYFISNSLIQMNLASTTTNVSTVYKPKKLNSEPSVLSVGSPVRLKIPEINVDAAIEYVGLTSKGAMDVPKGSNNVAWFKLGQRPGENGNAVIAGHYGSWKNGNGSVFDNLNKLRKGDTLSIEDDKGLIISFVVRESRSYDPGADASDVFGSSDGKPHLNLITCEGTWDEVSKSYPMRLVVFTDKE